MKILYVDMDNVLVNFQSGIDRLSKDDFNKYKGEYDKASTIFYDGSFGRSTKHMKTFLKYDTYILSTVTGITVRHGRIKLNGCKSICLRVLSKD